MITGLHFLTFRKNLFYLAFVFFALFATNVFASPSNPSNYFVDSEVSGFNFLKPSVGDSKTFQLFSHGKPGELLINGQWMNPTQIAKFIKPLLSADQNHLNIYGCEFGKGEKGLRAVEYLQSALAISVSASDDITGKGGDWDLEVGPSISNLKFSDYPFSLQTCAGAIGGMLPGDDFDGDGVCNDLDYDDDNDGIVDVYEVNVNATTCAAPGKNIKPTGQASIQAGATTIGLTSAQTIAITDVQSGTEINIPTSIIGKVSVAVPATSVNQIRFYNFTNAALGNTSAPHVTKIDKVRFYNAQGKLVHEELNVIPTTYTAGNYYAINFSTPLEGVTSYELTNLRGSTAGLGFRDVFIVGCSQDFDGDGFPNQFDTDSDNDGCPDAVESNANPPAGGNAAGPGYKVSDLDGRNMVDIATYPIGTNATANTYGVPNSDRNNPIASTYDAAVQAPECDACSPSSSVFSDYDGDGVGDKCDLDLDNDGILNLVECPDFTEIAPLPLTYLNLKNAVVLADPNPNDYVGPSLFAPDAAITLDGKCVDVRIDVQQMNTAIVPFFAWNIAPIGRTEEIKLFNGSGNNFYHFTVNYFECGTTTPIELSTIYTIEDIDGDCDWNADNISDNPLCDNFTQNKINDDWVSINTGEIASYKFSDPTLVYSKIGGSSTYFFSSGANNENISGINGITPTGSTQKVFLTYKTSSSFSFDYNTGQYGGIYMNFQYSAEAVCDFDQDGLPDVIDLDSDADGCPDAIEGGGTFGTTDVAPTTMSGGSTGITTSLCSSSSCVDANGVPIAGSAAGQTLGTSQDSTIINQFCIPPDTIITDTISCPICSVIGCKTEDDIPKSQVVEYKTCDAPTGYVVSAPDANGCVTISLDPNNPQKNDTLVSTCVVAVGPNGLVDTTYILIPISKDAFPVDITFIKAYPTAEGNTITWRTANEVNFDRFIIEKKINNSTEGFISIGEVHGGLNSYTFVDTKTTPGLTYYRLKNVDLDGSFAYSPTLSVSSEGGADYLVYPNPTNSRSFKMINNSELESYKLVNSGGVEVPLNYTKTSSEHVFTIKNKVEEGIYIFQYKTVDGENNVKKISLINN